ncbi:MAG: hypothetical protein ABI758_06960 [Candidatus Woesebacteria bacterium]
MERDNGKNNALFIQFHNPDLLYEFVSEKIALYGDDNDTDAQEQATLLNLFIPQLLPEAEILPAHPQFKYKDPEWNFELEMGAVLSINAKLDGSYTDSGAKVQLRMMLDLDWAFMEEDREAQLANDPLPLIAAFDKSGYDVYAYQPFLPPAGNKFIVTDVETGAGYEEIRSITTGDITEIVVSNSSRTILAKLYLNTSYGEREDMWDEVDRGKIHFWTDFSELESKFHQGLEDYTKILSILLSALSESAGFEPPTGEIIFDMHQT